METKDGSCSSSKSNSSKDSPPRSASEMSSGNANFDLNNAYDFVLKVRVSDRVSPSVDSVVSVWPAANFQERECYDMFGVTFKNHPDHRRILCPDDWEGFPLRKDYNAPKYYNGMEVFPDSKMNLEDREFIIRQKMIREQQNGNAQ